MLCFRGRPARAILRASLLVWISPVSTARVLRAASPLSLGERRLASARRTKERRRYDGSIECFSAERDAFRKKQSLKPLPLLQRGLYPEIRRTR